MDDATVGSGGAMTGRHHSFIDARLARKDRVMVRYLFFVGLLVSCGGSVDDPTEAHDARMDAFDSSNAQPNAETSTPDEKPLDAAAATDVSSTELPDARSEVAQGTVNDAFADVAQGTVNDARADVGFDTMGHPLDSSASLDAERDALQCQPGALACADNQPIVCNAQGNWLNSGVPCSFLCISGYCTGCLEGVRQCNGSVVQVCSNGVWMQEAVCAFICLAGNCNGICQPGATRCVGDGGSEVCDALGEWQTVSAGCPSSATTDAGDDGG